MHNWFLNDWSLSALSFLSFWLLLTPFCLTHTMLGHSGSWFLQSDSGLHQKRRTVWCASQFGLTTEFSFQPRRDLCLRDAIASTCHFSLSC